VKRTEKSTKSYSSCVVDEFVTTKSITTLSSGISLVRYDADIKWMDGWSTQSAVIRQVHPSRLNSWRSMLWTLRQNETQTDRQTDWECHRRR